MILIRIKLFWLKSETFFNKIDVLCFFNHIILKIVHPEQYIKRLIEIKLTVWLHYFLKIKFSLDTIKYVDI